MHELGILYNIVDRVLEVVDQNGLVEVEAIVLTVGENSGLIPSFLHACYDPAVDGTILETAKLEIQMITANGVCATCEQVFAITAEKGICPKCGSDEHEIISGEEFMIKEIRAR